MHFLKVIARSPLWSQPPLTVAVNLVVMLAFVLVVGAIVMDFKNCYRQSKKVLKSDRSLLRQEAGRLSFVGGSLIYANPLSRITACGVFVPMMYVGAKKEDALLFATFAGGHGKVALASCGTGGVWACIAAPLMTLVAFGTCWLLIPQNY